MVEDLGSTNGTEVDGELIEGRESLGKLHVLSFGGSGDFVFCDPAFGSEHSGIVELIGDDSGTIDKTQVDFEMPALPERLGESTDPDIDKTQVGAELPTLPANLSGDPNSEDSQ